MIPPKKLEGYYRIFDLTRDVLIVLIFSFVILSGAVDIFLRYVTHLGSLKWTDEILRYLNIWVVFLGAGVGVKRGSHMSVDFFLRKFFKSDTVKVIQKMMLVIILLTLLVLVISGTSKVMNYLNVQIQATTMSIAWFYLAIPLGCLFMIGDYILILIYGAHPFSHRSGDK
jgi:TRAP-type C4-dicarboxylate transport system permease small subunit